MKRTMLLVAVLALLIMPCGLFVQQESVANAETATVSQGAMMIADSDVVEKTQTTTERPKIEENRTTTTTVRPEIEENRTKTKTKTETNY